MKLKEDQKLQLEDGSWIRTERGDSIKESIKEKRLTAEFYAKLKDVFEGEEAFTSMEGNIKDTDYDNMWTGICRFVDREKTIRLVWAGHDGDELTVDLTDLSNFVLEPHPKKGVRLTFKYEDGDAGFLIAKKALL